MNANHEDHKGYEEALSGFLPSISLRALRVLRGRSIHLLRASTVLTVFALAACGGGGDGGDPPPLGTLAYVETECRDTKEGFVERQALRIRQGEREPVTVFETPGVGPFFAGIGGLCGVKTQGRLGQGSITYEAFQAVAVSPDGAGVAFDVTDEFSVNPPLPLNLPPEQKGIFWVRADGTGLRRLGPPVGSGPSISRHLVLACAAGKGFGSVRAAGRSPLSTRGLTPTVTKRTRW